jgi:hypothetical protein
MKKPTKSRLKKRADTAFSLWVRKTIGHCQAEGYGIKCSSVLQCAHIVTRSNLTLRYNANNVLCLCSAHHFWFHRHPLEFVEFLLQRYVEKFNYVQKHKNELTNYSLDDYKKLIEMYV